MDPKPSLILVTNPDNGYPEEDIFLAQRLAPAFEVKRATPRETIALAPAADLCLVRNAWPSREFEDEFRALRNISGESGVPFYNPFHRTFYLERKTYLTDLEKAALPVIPTVLSLQDIGQLPEVNEYIVKPLNGCGSWNVRRIARKDLTTADVEGCVLQPYLALDHEISLTFIDNHFVYARRSRERRWDMVPWEADKAAIAWAQQFVDWNNMPYGLQRIDAGRLADGRMLLMEIEDIMPYLGLQEIAAETCDMVIATLTQSLRTVLHKRGQG